RQTPVTKKGGDWQGCESAPSRDPCDARPINGLARRLAPGPHNDPQTAIFLPAILRMEADQRFVMTPDNPPQRRFWQVPLADLLNQLAAGKDGLRSTEVVARRLRYGPNTLEARRRLSLPLKFLSRFRNPLVLILLVAAATSAGT